MDNGECGEMIITEDDMKKILVRFMWVLFIAFCMGVLSGCSTFGNGKIDSPVQISVIGRDNLGNQYDVELGPDGFVASVTSVVGGNLYAISEDGFTVTIPTEIGPMIIMINRVEE